MSFSADKLFEQKMPVATAQNGLLEKEPMPSKPPAPRRSLAPGNGYQYRYDYDVGYLVKSPCRECELMSSLPACMTGCHLLENIQVVLATTLSSCKRG